MEYTVYMSYTCHIPCIWHICDRYIHGILTGGCGGGQGPIPQEPSAITFPGLVTKAIFLSCPFLSRARPTIPMQVPSGRSQQASDQKRSRDSKYQDRQCQPPFHTQTHARARAYTQYTHTHKVNGFQFTHAVVSKHNTPACQCVSALLMIQQQLHSSN